MSELGVDFARSGIESAVDPSSVTSLISMCHGAVDSLDKTISRLRERLGPIMINRDSINAIPGADRPPANCEVGQQLSELYFNIASIERSVNIYLGDINL